VLSIGRLGADSADYYLAEVAGGAEDYSLADNQKAERWLGGGAEQLDLEGRVAGPAGSFVARGPMCADARPSALRRDPRPRLRWTTR
jgi:hypothetical protein